MKYISYQGASSVRRLSPDDLAKKGGELTEPLSFRRGEAVEVNESVAKALLDHPDFFGSFAEVEEPKSKAPVEPEPDPENLPRGSVDVRGTTQVDQSVKARSKSR